MTAVSIGKARLFTASGPNLFTYLPTALKHYPAYAATGSQAVSRRADRKPASRPARNSFGRCH